MRASNTARETPGTFLSGVSYSLSTVPHSQRSHPFCLATHHHRCHPEQSEGQAHMLDSAPDNTITAAAPGTARSLRPLPIQVVDLQHGRCAVTPHNPVRFDILRVATRVQFDDMTVRKLLPSTGRGRRISSLCQFQPDAVVVVRPVGWIAGSGALLKSCARLVGDDLDAPKARFTHNPCASNVVPCRLP